MTYAPIARIVLRYLVGALVGMDAGNILAADPDIVTYAALGIGVAVEAVYAFARKRGWAT